jgi:hypothetical protein
VREVLPAQVPVDEVLWPEVMDNTLNATFTVCMKGFEPRGEADFKMAGQETYVISTLIISTNER